MIRVPSPNASKMLTVLYRDGDYLIGIDEDRWCAKTGRRQEWDHGNGWVNCLNRDYDLSFIPEVPTKRQLLLVYANDPFVCALLGKEN